ncbi:hypothetical protein HDU85_002661 [Gaertneriomyces sp. JEL0708]|nr:hypothetical protein HDU85_002661 [Gaertneriomyces sp. JEL0708]
MPTVAAARAFTSALSLQSKTAVIIGATSGIGYAVAHRLASLGANIVACARNPTTGAALLESLRDTSGSHQFLQGDISRIKDARRIAGVIKEKCERVHYLVLSAGIFSMNGRTETEEGLDVKMATHYYGRWAIIEELVSRMEETVQAEGCDVRVLSVLAAAKGGAVPMDDMDLKNTFGLKKCADTTSTYNDLMVEAFSKRHPTVSFMHMYPGFVDTPLLGQAPWWVRGPMKVVAPLFSTKASDCAECVAYALTRDEYKDGWRLLNEKADAVKATLPDE